MSRRLSFGKTSSDPIENYSSRDASSVHLGSGSGEAHTYVVHIEAGGEIGEHETGFGQLFIVIDGQGWVRTDTDSYQVGVGDAIFIDRGTLHSKGSETGMTAVMVQVFDLEPGLLSPGNDGEERSAGAT